MSDYIDSEKCDMQEVVFNVIKGFERMGWDQMESKDDLVIQRISGAMTNVIFKITMKDKKCDPLLFRVYGNCTDLFFNRTEELKFFKILSDNDFGIELIKSFPGGRLEVWRSGYDAITAPCMRSKAMSEKIAKNLAHMHMIDVGPIDMDRYYEHYYVWIETIHKICKKEEFKTVRIDLLKAEVDDLVRLMKNEDFEYVFGHHDLQHGNILANQDNDIIFVDYEYAGITPVGADIANHFCEWMTDYNLPDSHILRRETYPTIEQQNYFVTCYLKERFGKEPSSEEVEKLRMDIQKQEVLSHMHWFLWGLLQYQLSDIDWNYWDYTKNRWGYYMEMKKKMFGVEALPIMP